MKELAALTACSETTCPHLLGAPRLMKETDKQEVTTQADEGQHGSGPGAKGTHEKNVLHSLRQQSKRSSWRKHFQFNKN